MRAMSFFPAMFAKFKMLEDLEFFCRHPAQFSFFVFRYIRSSFSRSALVLFGGRVSYSSP